MIKNNRWFYSSLLIAVVLVGGCRKEDYSCDSSKEYVTTYKIKDLVTGAETTVNTMKGSFDYGTALKQKELTDKYNQGVEYGKAIGPQAAQAEGQADGTRDGYNEAYAAEYALVKASAVWTNLYNAGKAVGVVDAASIQQGTSKGTADGSAKGIADGRTDGYKKGYSDGYSLGKHDANLLGCNFAYRKEKPAEVQKGYDQCFIKGYGTAAEAEARNLAKYNDGLHDGKFNQNPNYAKPSGIYWTTYDVAKAAAKPAGTTAGHNAAISDATKEGTAAGKDIAYKTAYTSAYTAAYGANYTLGYSDLVYGYGRAPSRPDLYSGTGGMQKGYLDGWHYLCGY